MGGATLIEDVVCELPSVGSYGQQHMPRTHNYVTVDKSTCDIGQKSDWSTMADVRTHRQQIVMYNARYTANV